MLLGACSFFRSSLIYLLCLELGRLAVAARLSVCAARYGEEVFEVFAPAAAATFPASSTTSCLARSRTRPLTELIF